MPPRDRHVVEIDEYALEVRRARAEARRRLFGEVASTTRVGRYELGRPLGAGAMGTVYRARDLDLQRDVALKVLHPPVSRDQSERARRRFLREGRAMARIDHENVVTVLDVGNDGERAFLAMELVEGGDLSMWLRAGPSAIDVVHAFVGAARGLAAAHDAGVVHRDFKPHNVLRSRRGDVKVVDFGLAAAVKGFTDAVEGESQDLTAAGTVLGTRAYMAPEQSAGVVDARSDQYAFCVALGEAFSGVTARAALRRRIEAIVARGCAPDPDERFPDMHAVVQALANVTSRSARPLWVLIGGVAVVTASWLASSSPSTPMPDPAAREAGAGRGTSPREAYAIRRALETARQLDREGDLEAARLESLRAIRLASEAHDALLESDAWLLRAQFAERMSEDERALEAATSAAWLAIEAGDDRRQADAATNVAFLHAANAGRLDEAHRWAGLARAAVRRLDVPADLEIQLQQLDGTLAMARGEFTAARAEFERALDLARALHRSEPRALVPLLTNVGAASYSSGDFEAAVSAWLEAVRIEEKALGPDHYEVASALSNLAVAQMAGGDDETAAANHRRALEIRLASLELHSPKIADSHHNLGIALARLERFGEALDHHEAALRIRTQAYGAAHPAVGTTYAAIGNLALAMEAWDDARSNHQRAIDLWIPSMGGEHPDVVRSRARIAEADFRRGQLAQALHEIRSVLEVWEPRLGPTHPDVVAARSLRDDCEWELRRPGKL